VVVVTRAPGLVLKPSSDCRVSPIDLPRFGDWRFELVPFLPASVSSETADGDTVVVRLGGAVGVANVGEVATGILDVLGRTGSDLIVDLRDVRFIDSRVVRSFLLALRQAEERKHWVVLIRPDPAVWRTVQLSGLDGAFPNCADPIEVSRQRGGRPAVDPTMPGGRGGRVTVDEGARLGASSCSPPSPARIGARVLDRERAEPAFEVQTRRPLTPRERRVLFELARGRTTRAAAAAIGLSPHTVRSHLKSALRKLGAETRTQAVALAITQGAIVVGALPLGASDPPPAQLGDDFALVGPLP
jgi:anti-anti-sigma factor